MAIAFLNTGTASSGTTSVTPAYNAAVYANALALLVVTNKYPTNGPSTPAGWTLVGQASGGSGSAGADAGDVYVTVFKKVLDGTETGTVTVTVTSSNSTTSQIYQFVTQPTTVTAPYTKGDGWLVDMVSGTDVAAGTSWSATASSAIGLKYGDLLLAVSSINSNLYTSASHVITAVGVDLFTLASRSDFGAAAGDNVRQTVSEVAVIGGKEVNVTPVYTATLSGTAGDAPAGVTAFVRLRETRLRIGIRHF